MTLYTNSAGVAIAATTIAPNLDRDAPLEQRVRAAMRLALNDDAATFLCTDDQRFRGAVGAVLLCCSEEERQRVTNALDALKALSAAISGVPVDFGAVLAPQADDPPLPLLGIWHETKQELGL